MSDYRGTQARADALIVGCTFCHAIKGEPCVNKITDEPLWHFAAHLVRIQNAELEAPF